jgi:hypothetical protein
VITQHHYIIVSRFFIVLGKIHAGLNVTRPHSRAEPRRIARCGDSLGNGIQNWLYAAFERPVSSTATPGSMKICVMVGSSF